MAKEILNVSYYDFFPVPDPHALRNVLEERLRAISSLGTVLIAKEGINFNLAGPVEALRGELLSWVESKGLLGILGARSKILKESFSESYPFRYLRVKVKKEIVTMGRPELDVGRLRGPHLSAAEFRAVLQNPEEWLILDVRNDFEFEMGSFRNAKAVGMKSFRDFPLRAKELRESVPLDKNIAMFCTGGVRCEKASALMRQEGFHNVHQLEGGILKYFEENKKEFFDGECFIFDERETLDPSEIRLQNE